MENNDQSPLDQPFVRPSTNRMYTVGIWLALAAALVELRHTYILSEKLFFKAGRFPEAYDMDDVYWSFWALVGPTLLIYVIGTFSLRHNVLTPNQVRNMQPGTKFYQPRPTQAPVHFIGWLCLIAALGELAIFVHGSIMHGFPDGSSPVDFEFWMGAITALGAVAYFVASRMRMKALKHQAKQTREALESPSAL